jgi:PAS domain S-box-containing protein
MISGALPRGTLNDLVFSPLYFVAAVGAFMAHRSPRVDPRAARGFYLIGWAWLGSGIAFVLWAAYALAPLPILDKVAWSLYNLYYPLTLAGLWYVTALPRTRLAWGRLALDSLIVVAAAVTLQWYFIIRFDPASVSSRVSTAILFAGELLIVFGAAAVAHRERDVRDPAWPTILSLGLFTSSIADFVYEYSKIESSRWGGPAGDLMLAIGAALVATSGFRVVAHKPAAPVGQRNYVAFGRTLLPYIAITLVAALLTLEFWKQEGVGSPISGLVLGGGGLMALLIGRLLVAQRESASESRARAAQDARFRSLVLRSSDAHLIVDSGGILRYASPAFLAMTGSSPPETDHHALSDFIGQENVQALLSNPTTAPGRPVRWLLGPPSTQREVEATTTDLRGDHSVAGIVVNLKDVTERNRLEGQLRQAQALEIAGRLSAGVAHDFNNVLTVVLGNIQLAQQAGGRAVADELQTATAAAKRGAALARQLLALSKPRQPNPRPMDLGEEVFRLEGTLRSVLPPTINIALSRPTEPVPVMLDDVQVERVLLNLSLNARDAMPRGGTLRIEVSRGSPALATGGAGSIQDWALLTVSDEGHGMDEATLRHAFDPFFTTKALGLGTGLGLATVENIVNVAGGSVSIASHPNVGTTVSVRLPLVDVALLPVVEATPPAANGRGHVLIVDDELMVRRVLTRYLSSVGFTVSEARDGVEALEVLERLRWDVDAVLTDLVMPRLSGEELARQIMDRDAGLPVICMSGTSGTQTSAPVPWSAEQILPKPLELEVVAARIAGVMGRAA